MRRRLFHVTAAAGLVVACTSGPPPPVQDSGAYERTVTADRTLKDRAFRARDNQDSPIPAADRATFPGLNYYPVDAKYRVPASLAEAQFNPPVVIELQTSIDTRRRMRKVGTLNFMLAATPLALTAFADVDARTPTTWNHA